MTTNVRVAGIVGGMGPAAGLDLANKVQRVCQRTLQDVPFVLLNEGDVPDRTEALLSNGPDFVPAIVEKLQRLAQAGAQFAALGCNTAHARLEEIRVQSSIPVLDMIGITCYEIDRVVHLSERDATRIGVLGTPATIRLDLYGTRLRRLGFEVIPCDDETIRLAHEGIVTIKRHDFRGGERLLHRARARLISAGATVIVMGCTEIPLVLDGQMQPRCTELRPMTLVDPTLILAQAIVATAHNP